MSASPATHDPVEFSALVDLLLKTEQQLERLSAGQIDSVSDAKGQTLLLRRAQEHMRHSEATTRAAILDALPASVALLDAQGVIVAANDAWTQVCEGYPLHGPTYGVGLNYVDACHAGGERVPTVGRQVADGIRAVLHRTLTRFSIEYQTQATPDPAWFELTITPLSSEPRTGAVVMHLDISDRVRSASTMRRTTELLQAVADGTPDHVTLKDLHGRYLFCNHAMASFRGRTVDELIGRDGVGTFAAEELHEILQSDRRVVESGRASAGEYTLTGIDGPRIFLSTKAPYRDGHGNVLGVISIARDITDRKHAEIERDRERDLLRTLIDALPDMVYTKDLAGRFRISNKTTQALLGVENEKTLSGKTAFDVVTAELARVESETDRRALAGEDIVDVEEHSVGAQGQSIWHLSTKVALRDASGRIHGLVGIKRDVTDLKHEQQALRDNQALLSVAGRLAQVGAWSIALPAARVLWTDVLANIHDEVAGYSPSVEDALGYYLPQYRAEIRDAVRSCMADGTSFDVKAEIVTARGRTIAVRAMGEAVRDRDGRIVRVQGALQDLSEQRRAEEETRRLASTLTTTLESITDGFFALDRQWRFIYFNSEAERLLGHSRGEMLGRSMWDVFPDGVGTEFYVQYHRAMAGEVGIKFEGLYSPWQAWMSVDCYPTEEGLSVYFRDVTAKRATRQRLELLEASVSRLSEVVLITEATSLDEPGPRIVFVNEAFERVTGYARETAVGKSPRILQGPLTDRLELDRIRHALSRHEPVHAELINYHADGSTYWVEMDIVPFGLAGNDYSHFVAIERDITERKGHEASLARLTEELEDRVRERTIQLSAARDEADLANRAKSSFLATMSHEIRTPMNGVIGMIDVLEETQLKGHQSEMVDLIRDSAHSLLKIIEDILDFSKIEAGKLSVEREPMNLAEMIEKVCSMLDHMAAKRGIDFSVYIDPNIPRTVLGDETRLRQVLLNLTSNAIKFSGGREGVGNVSVRAVLAKRSAQQAEVDFVVTDDGIGMSELTLEKLFLPFSQADASTTRRFGGTGLGLAICSMLVELMGGRISVRSEFQKGSVFSVRLPFAVPIVEGTETETPPVIALNCRIIGAEQPLSTDLTTYLATSGAQVQRFEDLRAAAAAEQPPGSWSWLILPDELVPDLETLQAMPRGVNSGETRFVVLTRGKRHRPRLEAVNLMSVDANALYRRALLDALAPAYPNAEEDLSKPASVSALAVARAPSREEAIEQGRLILVAEDNETNRKVIMRQMPLIGFACEIVESGRQALACWRTGDFALLLTDLHMPEMDGYDLATVIRNEEGGSRRIPIIALTANVLREEELRCKAAGMDSYLTKPVRLPLLKAELEKFLGPVPTARIFPTTTHPLLHAVVDLSVLKALVGDDPVVIAEIVEAFRRSALLARTALREHVLNGEAQSLSGAAHTFKSVARSVGAQRLGDVCAQLEHVAQVEKEESLSELLEEFESELDAVMRFLDVN